MIREAAVVLDEDVRIPAAAHSLAAFRAWVHSDQFPERGRIDYLEGDLEVDLSPEDLYTHGVVKAAIAAELHACVVKPGRTSSSGAAGADAGPAGAGRVTRCSTSALALPRRSLGLLSLPVFRGTSLAQLPLRIGARGRALGDEANRSGAISGPSEEDTTVLRWALIFLVVALIAAVLGFGGIAGGAAEIAKILFFLFLIVFVVSLIMGLVRRA